MKDWNKEKNRVKGKLSLLSSSAEIDPKKLPVDIHEGEIIDLRVEAINNMLEEKEKELKKKERELAEQIHGKEGAKIFHPELYESEQKDDEASKKSANEKSQEGTGLFGLKRKLNPLYDKDLADAFEAMGDKDMSQTKQSIGKIQIEPAKEKTAGKNKPGNITASIIAAASKKKER